MNKIFTSWLIFIFLIVLPFFSIAQAPGGEFKIPFSEKIVTEHVNWAKPYFQGKTKVLFVPSITAGRTVIELAQRFDLDYETVCIDEDWTINLWSYNMNYSRVARHGYENYKNPYSYLFGALKKTNYDVMVLPSIRGWNEMPAELRELITERVKEGMGLIFIHPYEGQYPETMFLNEGLQTVPVLPAKMGKVPLPEGIIPGVLWSISPLINCLNNSISYKGQVSINEEALRQGCWQKAADHFIVNDVPLELYPYDFMKYYKYDAAPLSSVVLKSGSGDPVCAVREYGKGRVVSFGFFNYGMIPFVQPASYETGEGDYYWEMYYLLLGRAILWAGKKESGVHVNISNIAQDFITGKLPARQKLSSIYKGFPDDSEVRVIFKDADGKVEQELSANDLNKPYRFVSAGKHFIDFFIEKNGKVLYSGSHIVCIPQKFSIKSIDLERSEYKDPDIVNGHLTYRSEENPSGMAVIELLDNWDRVLVRNEIILNETGSVAFDLPIENFLTRSGWVNCILKDKNGIVQDVKKKFIWVAASTLGNWDEFMVDMRWATYVPIVYPWQKARSEALRQMGVNLLDDPYTNFEMNYRAPRKWGRDPKGEFFPGMWEYYFPGFKVQYAKQLNAYQLTRDKSYLIHEPCLSDPDYQKEQIRVLKRIAAEFKRYKSIWYDLGNECSLMPATPPLDLCFSKYCLAAFRDYLKKDYGDLASLNKEWDTDYRNWQDVMPQTLEEVRKTGNFAPWADHRRYMQIMWAERIKQFGDVVREIDPNARICFTNMREPSPYQAVDYYNQLRVMETARTSESFTSHKDFQPDIKIFGGSAYGNTGESLKSSFLPGVLDGQVGTSAWWYYTCFEPDLTPTQSGAEITEYYDLVMSGLGKLMLNAKRVAQPIALHYSMNSANGIYITDGKPFENPGSPNFERHLQNRRVWWDRILCDLGMQYTWLAQEQIEDGDLDPTKFKALILPNSISISGEEAEQIRYFVKQGGIVIADTQPGLMDKHAKWQNPGMLDDVFGTSVAGAKIGSDMISNRFGKGKAFLLNKLAIDYKENQNLGEQIGGILDEAQVMSPVKILTADGEKLKVCETTYFEYGDVFYFGIVRNVSDAYSGRSITGLEVGGRVPVTIQLPEKGYLYETLSGKFLGYTDQAADTLSSSDMRMYALLPEKADELVLNIPENKIYRGENFNFQLKGQQSREKDIQRIVNFKFIRPDGSVCWYFNKNIIVPAAEPYAGNIKLAYNEMPGEWKFIIKDFISNQVIEKPFYVTSN